MTASRWVAIALATLALAAGVALSGGLYTVVSTEGQAYRLNRWTGSVEVCGFFDPGAPFQRISEGQYRY